MEMDPYIGQKFVADKHRTLLAEAESERLARRASMGNRSIWKAVLRAFAAGAQRLLASIHREPRMRSNGNTRRFQNETAA